jgi:TPR repeat protein
MDMARIEMPTADDKPPGRAGDGDALFRLGMRYAAEGETSADRVLAHKWFNIAAMLGNAQAIRLRREIAAEMSPAEIAAAQRAAREWFTIH